MSHRIRAVAFAIATTLWSLPAQAQLTFTSAQISLATNAQTPAGHPDGAPHPQSGSVSTAVPADLALETGSSVVNGNPITSFAFSAIDSRANFINGGLGGLFAADVTYGILDPVLGNALGTYDFVYRFTLGTTSGFEGYYSLFATNARTATILSLTGPNGFAGVTGNTGSQTLSLAPGDYELRFGSSYLVTGPSEGQEFSDAYSFRITPSVDPGVPGVPEPAAWGLLILGFGAVGGAMRRRGAEGSGMRMQYRHA